MMIMSVFSVSNYKISRFAFFIINDIKFIIGKIEYEGY